jgi:class 3 adenylate cyclase
MDADVLDLDREHGFLLIADMEGSTQSKFRLGEKEAFVLLREHNRIIIERCRGATPVGGTVINSLGDAVVAKFPAGTDGPNDAQLRYDLLSGIYLPSREPQPLPDRTEEG